jgi:hypothetical protein
MTTKKSQPIKRLNATEAIYAFTAWLTTRPKAVILSTKHNASVLPPLIEAFREAHELPRVRNNYGDSITPMVDPELDKYTNDPALSQNQCARCWNAQDVLDIVLGPLLSLPPAGQATVIAKVMLNLKDQHQRRLEQADQDLSTARKGISKEATFLADLDKIVKGDVVII